ncbi:hypothetical protein HPB47_028287 [Ixodes persulcatus]|uniref:Uncharacterized protein n=1 Tax=Ixodes persulcatus TaxID=34615 RepID=A0AC60PTQ5_IXOPE|nr:hypothetical protein HPB47_028287 [Ixodes persulcatus]
MANPVDTPAVTADDEADSAAPSENQSPPLPEVSALVVELQARVAEQAAQVSQLTCNLQRAREELTEAKNEVLKLTRHMELLEDSNQKLQQKLSQRFSINCFKDRPDDVQFYTGLPNYDAYLCLLQHLNPGSSGENIKMWSTSYSQGSKQGRPRSLPPHDELFLVLEVDEDMPPAFREKYPTTRVILDATEIKCQVPSSLTLQSASFSSYKSTNTFKGLIGISPDGTVTFASQLFLGSMSDRECVRQSGFLKLPFDDKDSVMADKGFLISDLLEEINPVYARCVLFYVEVDFSVEASIPPGIWALHLNDSMRSRFGWIPHNPVWRRPKPWAWRGRFAESVNMDGNAALVSEFELPFTDRTPTERENVCGGPDGDRPAGNGRPARRRTNAREMPRGKRQRSDRSGIRFLRGRPLFVVKEHEQQPTREN